MEDQPSAACNIAMVALQLFDASVQPILWMGVTSPELTHSEEEEEEVHYVHTASKGL